MDLAVRSKHGVGYGYNRRQRISLRLGVAVVMNLFQDLVENVSRRFCDLEKDNVVTQSLIKTGSEKCVHLRFSRTFDFRVDHRVNEWHHPLR